MDFIDLKTQYRRIKPAVDARIARVLQHLSEADQVKVVAALQESAAA